MLHAAKLFALLPLLASMAAGVNASPMHRREVPQEQSHKKFLTATQTQLQLNNPAGIVDPVFGLLGNAAAAQGAGSITNLDCLQQATADQAFTNAKAAGDVDGMTNALVYRALERNTIGIGLRSTACNEVAKNPEIAAIKQHQDPAADGAAAENKAITLELAKQIASVGGDPLIAIQSGTFAPGDPADNTFAGNTCDDPNDAEGCIFTQNLLVPDASEEEMLAAVGGIAAQPNNNNAVDQGAGAGAAAPAPSAPPPANAADVAAHPLPPPAQASEKPAAPAPAPPAPPAAGQHPPAAAPSAKNAAVHPPPPAAAHPPPAPAGEHPAPPPPAVHAMPPPPPPAGNELVTPPAANDTAVIPPADNNNSTEVLPPADGANNTEVIPPANAANNTEVVPPAADQDPAAIEVPAGCELIPEAGAGAGAAAGPGRGQGAGKGGRGGERGAGRGQGQGQGQGNGRGFGRGGRNDDREGDGRGREHGQGQGGQGGAGRLLAALIGGGNGNGRGRQGQGQGQGQGVEAGGNGHERVVAAGHMKRQAAGVDVGPCTDFSMSFKGGNDGRPLDQLTFIPNDQQNFGGQQSALNPNIIANFMCDQFVNGCAKSAATRDLCKTVAADLAQREGAGELQRDQTFADAWLSDVEAAFGITSTGQGTAGAGGAANGNANDDNVAVDNNAADDANVVENVDENVDDNANQNENGIQAGEGAAVEAPVVCPAGTRPIAAAVAAPAAGEAGANATAPSVEAPVASDVAVAEPNVAVAQGENVQKFVGALNGVAAPPVVQAQGNRPFSVGNATFQNIGAAINRSCAVQHNGCANAFNRGEGDSNVAACDQQEQECLASGQVAARVRRSRVFRV